MLSSQEEMAERKRVLDNDRKVREGGTFHQFAEADANTPLGRFSAISNAYVVGSKSDVASAYPAASSAHQTELPPEPPLSFDNPALEPSLLAQAQAPPNPAPGDVAPSTTSCVERRDVGLGSFRTFRRF